MTFSETLTDILTPLIALGFGSLLIYYCTIYPSNRRLGVLVLLCFNAIMFLEYGRLALANSFDVSGLGYGTWPGATTRAIVFVVVLAANYNIFLRRKK